MALRDAAVRLTLSSGSFLSGLRQVTNAIEGAAKRAGAALKAAGSEGVKAMKSSLADAGGELKSMVKTAATLGGVLSAGGAAKTALDLSSKYKDIAAAIEAGTGKAVRWQDIGAQIEATAARWSQGNGEVADSFKALYDDIGDADFAASAVEDVTKAVTAGYGSFGALTNIVGQLNEKFGITKAQVPDALAAVIAMGNKGGASVEDMGEKIGILGASAKLAGLEGKGGLEQVVAMLNIADGATGSFKKSLSAVTGILDTLGDADKIKAIKKTLGVDAAGGNGLEKILQKTGGKKELLSKVFSGESLKLVSQFGETYQKAFTETEGTVKAKTAAALAAFHQALQAAGKQTLSASDLDAKAKERLQDPQRKLQEAMNLFTAEFTKPEMIAALGELAQSLPKVAKFMAQLVSFTANHPILAAAGGAAALGGGSFAKAAGGKLAVDISKKVLESSGTAISNAFTASVAQSGAWGTAGKALGVAAAALIAYEIGKAKIDEMFEQRGQETGDLAASGAAAFAASKGGSAEAKQKAADDLRRNIEAAERNKPGFFENAFAAGAHIASGGETPLDLQADNLAKARAELQNLEQSMGKGAGAGDKAASSLERAAGAAERAATALNKIRTPGAPGGGSNGLPPRPGGGPGFAGGG